MGAFGGGSTVENMMSGTRPLHVALPQAHLDNLQVYGRLEIDYNIEYSRKILSIPPWPRTCNRRKAREGSCSPRRCRWFGVVDRAAPRGDWKSPTATAASDDSEVGTAARRWPRWTRGRASEKIIPILAWSVVMKSHIRFSTRVRTESAMGIPGSTLRWRPCRTRTGRRSRR